MYSNIINFLMILGALLIDLSILRYYTRKKTIPIKNNVLFLKSLKVILLMSLINLATVISSFLVINPLSIKIHYILNIVYCIVYEISFLYFADYIFWNSGEREVLMESKRSKVLIAIISVLTLAFILKTDIFYIDSGNNFHFSKNHQILDILPCILLFASIAKFTISNRKSMGIRNKGILFGIIFLIVGILSDDLIIDIVIIDFFFAISMINFYISAENPEYFRSENIRCFNNTAFERLINEVIQDKKDFWVYAIEVSNMDIIKVHRGLETLNIALSQYAKWIESEFPNSYVYYTNNNCFNIVSFEEIEEYKYRDIIEKSKLKSFKVENGDVIFLVRGIAVDTKSPLCINTSYILNGEIYAIEKSSFKNEIIAVDEEVYKRVEYERIVHSIIHKCIENDSLKVYIQPYLGTKSGKIEAGEVLTRIIDEKHGFIMPGDFIPLAEKSGKIIEMSYCIFEKTCKYISDYDLQNKGLKHININCSPVQFQELELADKLKNIADKYKVDFSIFHFEVTETYMSNNKIMLLHIEKFKK